MKSNLDVSGSHNNLQNTTDKSRNRPSAANRGAAEGLSSAHFLTAVTGRQLLSMETMINVNSLTTSLLGSFTSLVRVCEAKPPDPGPVRNRNADA